MSDEASAGSRATGTTKFFAKCDLRQCSSADPVREEDAEDDGAGDDDVGRVSASCPGNERTHDHRRKQHHARPHPRPTLSVFTFNPMVDLLPAGLLPLPSKQELVLGISPVAVAAYEGRTRFAAVAAASR